MSEQPSAEIVETPAADASQAQAPQTLDEVYSQYDVQVSPAQQEPATPQPAFGASAPATPPPAPVHQTIQPDPVLEPAEWAKWHAEQLVQSRIAPIEASVNDVLARDRARQQAEAQAKQNVDINAAVKTVMGKIGEGADEDVALGLLAVRIQKDPKFAALWKSRETNPAAWNAALEVVGGNLKQTMTARLDPQTAEDQRAANASFSGREPQGTGMSDRERDLLNAPNREFDQWWNSRGG